MYTLGVFTDNLSQFASYHSVIALRRTNLTSGAAAVDLATLYRIRWKPGEIRQNPCLYRQLWISSDSPV